MEGGGFSEASSDAWGVLSLAPGKVLTTDIHPSLSPSPGLKMTGTECVEGMASGLYQELFAVIVSLINRYGLFCRYTNEPKHWAL